MPQFGSDSKRVTDDGDPAGRRVAQANEASTAPCKPRLLMLVTLAEVGGVGSYLSALLPALARSFDVLVVAYGPGPLAEVVRSAGARYIPLRHVRRPLRPWRDLAGIVELWRLFRRERPHIVHANSSKAGVLGRVAASLTGVPIKIFAVHGWASSAHTGLARRLYAWIDRAAARLTTAIVCVAESERQEGIRTRMCRASQTVVIHNGIGVAGVPRASHAGDVVQIVSVGRLSRPKDPETLIDALARIETAPFTALVVGEGALRPLISNRIAELGINNSVRLLGERNDVADLLASSDIFVLSSTSEALPISILEAMAAGLPVVASAVGGVPELVVEGETGLLVPPGNVDALSRAMRRLLDDRELRLRLGEAGRRRAEEHFGIERFRRAYLDLYTDLLAERRLPLPDREQPTCTATT